jgi:hypothetical protein
VLEGRDGSVVVYVMETGGPSGREAYRASARAIALEHCEIMEEILAEALPVEELLNPRIPGDIEVRETSAQPVGGLPTTKLKQQRR